MYGIVGIFNVREQWDSGAIWLRNPRQYALEHAQGQVGGAANFIFRQVRTSRGNVPNPATANEGR